MEYIATCMAVMADVDGVKTFVFKTKKEFSFQAGQFVSLVLPCPDGDIVRSYTISSAPVNSDVFTITVRAVPNGKGSNWLHDSLQAGMSIAFSGPFGHFIPSQHQDRKLLLLAAGSGITPHLSTLRHWRNQATQVNAHLIFSVRSPDQIIENQELMALVKQVKGLTMTIIPEHISGHVWQGISGRLDPVWLDAMVRDIQDREVYICGPAPYMAAVKDYLSTCQFDLTHYHEEAFISPEQVPTNTTSTNTTNSYEVKFARSGISVKTSGGESLLELAEKAGVAVKNACRAGICGACRTLKTAGSVNMQDLGGILPDEVNQGMVLLCCSQPSSDVVLDI